MMTGTNSRAAIDAQGVATAVTRLGALPEAREMESALLPLQFGFVVSPQNYQV